MSVKPSVASVALGVVMALGPGCPEPAAVDAGAVARCDAPFGRGGDPLSLERLRAEHRWASLRRHLRMLEAVEPGATLRRTAPLVDGLGDGATPSRCGTAVQVGRLLFEHEYTTADGLAQPFRRVQDADGGPETQACTSCHWQGGRGGSGSFGDNTLLGDGADAAAAEMRNPPALLGLGVVQAVAAEMTATLQQQRAAVVASARRSGSPETVDLTAKGVAFGRITAHPDGSVDTGKLEGVDPDLVIKPFGWRGDFETLGGFIDGALDGHFGPDVRATLTIDQQLALQLHLATTPMPQSAPPAVARELPALAPGVPPPTPIDFAGAWSRGHGLFDALGCSSCHRRVMVLDDPVVRLAALEVDLSRDVDPPLVTYDPALGGYPVAVFSDFKRHAVLDQPDERYMTRRLWGLAGTAPYFHDGRAASYDHAIAAHRGEAAFASAAFEALDVEDRAALRIYLNGLRRPWAVTLP